MTYTGYTRCPYKYHRRSQDFLCGGALFLTSLMTFLVITFFCMVIGLSVIYATNISSAWGAPRQIHPIFASFQ